MRPWLWLLIPLLLLGCGRYSEDLEVTVSGEVISKGELPPPVDCQLVFEVPGTSWQKRVLLLEASEDGTHFQLPARFESPKSARMRLTVLREGYQPVVSEAPVRGQECRFSPVIVRPQGRNRLDSGIPPVKRRK